MASGGLDAVIGEEDGEDGAVVRFRGTAAEGDVALVFLNDAVGDPKTEASAGGLLGGDEGLEDGFAEVRGDAMAGVRDNDAEPGRGVWTSARADAKADAATLAGGVEGVTEEVGEDLAEFVGAAKEKVA